LIKLPRSQPVPWKNGQGFTTQLAIDPPLADFSASDFLWRLSCAEIRNKNSFSQFPGYDRLLMVWKGDGLILNGKKLTPLVPLYFSGEEKIDCELLSGEVKDIGLIYQRGKLRPTMEVMDLKKNHSLQLNKGLHFLFCAQGGLTINSLVLNEGDTLQIDSPLSVMLAPDGLPAIVLKISLGLDF
jgi:hypothetical protein